MATSVERKAADLAEVGTSFDLGEDWRCRCGLEHSFGAYAAAHWDDVLTHKCDCGIERDFRGGVVKSLSTSR